MWVSKSLTQWLSRAHPAIVAVFAALSAFGVYFCMYAFRKPYSSAGFTGLFYLGIDYKVWLVTAQVIGYMLSKFYGIRFISGLSKGKQGVSIILLTTWAWIALLLFALVPAPYNILFLFLNGFPLGMIWGLVFRYLEGRRATEFMGAVMAISFIFSSGIVKTVGKTVTANWHYSEFWMPFITGGLFIIPLILFTWLLNHVPPPDKEDELHRSPRLPMTKIERIAFLKAFYPGIILAVITYSLLTILREIRDNFSNEMFTELGFGGNAGIFSITETRVSLIVLLFMGALVLVKNNLKAFMINHYIIGTGYLMAITAMLLFTKNLIGPISWMTLTGTGLYLSYVPYNALYFERMIATYKIRANVGFVMYIADAFGYLGSVLVLFMREFFALNVSWVKFYSGMLIAVCTIGFIGNFITAIYFRNKYYQTPSTKTLEHAT